MTAKSIINELQTEIFTASELSDILTAYKQARNRANSYSITQLKIGAFVKFKKSNSHVLSGQVIDILKKNVVVDCGINGKWNVAAGALEINNK